MSNTLDEAGLRNAIERLERFVINDDDSDDHAMEAYFSDGALQADAQMIVAAARKLIEPVNRTYDGKPWVLEPRLLYVG